MVDVYLPQELYLKVFLPPLLIFKGGSFEPLEPPLLRACLQGSKLASFGKRSECSDVSIDWNRLFLWAVVKLVSLIDNVCFSEAVIFPQLQYFIYVRFLFIILKRKAIVDFESFLSDRPNPMVWCCVTKKDCNLDCGLRQETEMTAWLYLCYVFNFSEKIELFALASKATIILHYSRLCTIFFFRENTDKREISHFVVCRKRDSKLEQLFSTRRLGKQVILAMKKNDVDSIGIWC